MLEGNNAVEKYRKIMGAANPENAENGTIRKLFALNVQEILFMAQILKKMLEKRPIFNDDEIVG